MKQHRHTPTWIIGTLAVVLLFAGNPADAGSCSNAKSDIVSTAVEAGSFDTLVAAVQAAGLVDALKAEGPLTVFAPTDAAFAKLPKGTLERLLEPENKEMLAAILTYHVVPGKLSADRVARLDQVNTLNGQRPQIRVARDGSLRIDQAAIITADIHASNGVIHVIDEVILPGNQEMSSTGSGEELIDLAIERGVPLYNSGQATACAAVYEVAAQGLLSSTEFGLSDHDRRTLTRALDKADATHDPRRQAWIMRHALDDVRDSLRDRAHDMPMPLSRR